MIIADVKQGSFGATEPDMTRLLLQVRPMSRRRGMQCAASGTKPSYWPIEFASPRVNDSDIFARAVTKPRDEWKEDEVNGASDDGKTTWIVENPATLINQAGRHVLVDARPGKHANSVRILRLRSK